MPAALTAASSAAGSSSPSLVAGIREQDTSRAAARAALKESAKPEPTPSKTTKAKTKVVAPPALRVTGSRYATADLSIRVSASKNSTVVTVIRAGTKVAVTGSVRSGFRYVSHQGKGRWVTDKYLSTKKPAPRPAGTSSAACPSGSKVESGLTKDAIRVHRSICARFPQISAYGGVRADSLPDHPSGRALDAMIANSSVGWQIANYVRSNAKRLGVSEVIYAQKIWTVQRSSEGWRSMSDRGSASANHYDHVHVTVYGSSGTG